MNWRKKALLALVSAMTAFVILVVGVAHLVLRPHTEKQEVIATEATLQRLATRVETDLAELRAQALGYSAWDDTYTYAISTSPEFLKKNFSNNALENTRFSWVALWNQEGKYLGSVSKGSGDTLISLPPSTVQALSEVVQASGTPDENGRVGLRWIDGKLTEMALLPIVQSDFKGAARGVFVAGRTLEGGNIAKLTEHEHFTLEFRGGDAVPSLGPNVSTTPSGAEVAFVSSSQIAARMPLKTYPGFPTIRIEIRSERPLLRAQERTIQLLTLAVIGGSCLMSVILWKIGERVFVQRLETLQRHVQYLGSERVARELQKFPGSDEVAQLANLTGTMALHLQEARKAAEAAAQAKSRFLSTMSHEIRTPLNAVLGYSSLLRSTALDPKQIEWLQALVSGGESLVGVISNILDFEKAENGRLEIHPKPTKIRPLILDTVASMAPYAASKELKLESGMEARVPEVLLLDAGRLRQILVNLISNAIKFTASGSVEVTISSTPTENAKKVRLEFKIHDTGPGVAPELIPRLFTPFTQADSSHTRVHGGVGMGLAITSRLVDAFGGEIRLESTSPLGSVFTFHFEAEVADKASVDAAADTLDVTPAAQTPLKVLVAEDNAVNRALIRTMLRQLGHECEFAVNGVEAFRKMQDPRFDVVLMDMQMPERDGCEATALYRSWERTSDRQAPLPIIALTANALPTDRDRCKAVGMDGYLNKPVKLADLRETLIKYTRDPFLESPPTH